MYMAVCPEVSELIFPLPADCERDLGFPLCRTKPDATCIKAGPGVLLFLVMFLHLFTYF